MSAEDIGQLLIVLADEDLQLVAYRLEDPESARILTGSAVVWIDDEELELVVVDGNCYDPRYPIPPVRVIKGRVLDMPTKEGTTGPWMVGDYVIDYAFNHQDGLEEWHIFEGIDPEGMPTPETIAKNMARRLLTERAWRTPDDGAGTSDHL